MADDTDQKPPFPPPSAVNAKPPGQPPSAQMGPGLGEGLGIAARSFGRGFTESRPSSYAIPQDRRWVPKLSEEEGQALPKGGHLPAALATYDPIGKQWYIEDKNKAAYADWLKRQQRPEEVEYEKGLQASQAEREKDVKRGGMWLSELPEFAGGMLSPESAMAGAANIGTRALRPIERTLGRAFTRVTEPVGRALRSAAQTLETPRSGAIRERMGNLRQDVPRPDPQGPWGWERSSRIGEGPRTWQQARAADRQMQAAGRGTLGMQMEPGLRQRAVTGTERIFGSMPGGHAIPEAARMAQTARARTSDRIVSNLTNGRVTIAPELIAEHIVRVLRTRPFTEGERAIIENAMREQGTDGGLDFIFRRYIANSRDMPMVSRHVIEPLTRNMNREERQMFAGYMFERMGSMGENGQVGQWTIDNFLRNWHGMDDAMHNRLFGAVALEGAARTLRGGTASYVTEMNELVRNIERLQPYAEMAQPQRGYRNWRFDRSARSVLSYGEAATFLGGLIDLLKFHNPTLLYGVGGVYVGTEAAALALTNPQTVRWLAAQVAKQAATGYARHREARTQESGGAPDVEFLNELNRVPQ